MHYLSGCNTDFCLFWGTDIYIKVNEEKNFLGRDFFLLIFIGGALFYTFWEAQSQYTIPYFYLLIPCSIRGYQYSGGMRYMSNVRLWGTTK